MSKHQMAVLGGLLALAASGCAAAADAPAKRDFTLPPFERVTNRTAFNVVIARGPQSVTVQGPAELVDRLDLVVRNGVLEIDMRRDESWRMGWRAPRGELRISLPALKGVATDASGDLRADSGGGEQFDAAIAGSGNMVLNGIAARRVRLSVDGSGDLTISGKAMEAEIAVSGSGNIDASGLPVTSVRADVAGSGDISARATGDAAVSVAGSGNVRVVGTDRCRKTVAGSGDVTCRK